MRQRSFTSIANTRGIAPSSVSRSISALESEIGVKLFQRTTRQIAPTDAGLLYYERVLVILEELETAAQLVNDAKEQPFGTLRVTASNAFGEMHLVPLIIEFNQRYPQLALELLLHDRYTDLVEERIDLAIRTGSLQSSSYVARQLMSMRFHIVASPEYLKNRDALTLPEQLSGHECLIFPRGRYHSRWRLKRNQKTVEIPIQGKHLVTNATAI